MTFCQLDRTVVELTPAQVGEFAGNTLELTGGDGSVLVMSTRARRSLTPGQLAVVESAAAVLALQVPTIELAGGSVRCMLAGIHMPPRSAQSVPER
ncbi:MAG TPA: arginine deiminase-related protein [Candidatus Lustribacter sp.]|nr:arginine deiminase-related protein [Candidatus Lustribacter sp.]